MPASLKRVRESMKVKATPKNVGLEMTIRVVAYDKGMIEVDGIPMRTPESGWTDAAEVIMTTLNEFHTQVRKRRAAL